MGYVTCFVVKVLSNVAALFPPPPGFTQAAALECCFVNRRVAFRNYTEKINTKCLLLRQNIAIYIFGEHANFI